MRKSILIVALAIGICALFAFGSMGTVTASYKTTLTTGFTSTPPTLDGNFTTDDEWDSAVMVNWWFEPTSDHPDNYIYIYIMNTNSTIYLMFDVTVDNTSEFNDYIGFAFDENDNGRLTANWYYSDPAEFYIFSYRDYYGWVSQVNDRYTVAWGFATSPNEDSYDHTIVEFAIPFADLDFEGAIGIGDTVGFHAEGVGTVYPEWAYPKTSSNISDTIGYDTENWATLTFGAYAPTTPAVPLTPTVTPVDRSQDIGMGLMALGFIIFLGAVFFRKELQEHHNYYGGIVIVSLIVILFGAMNYGFGYVKTIPYLVECIRTAIHL
jgi:hypothetical protein